MPTTPAPSTEIAWQPSDVYLLFAHEPYYPASAQEINASLVPGASLLHPLVRQPDGARIHERLIRGREPGEIVLLATLTHELGGGTDWPKVGDWETVVADLVQLIRTGGCDALSLGLPTVERALICSGPDTTVRVYDPATEDFIPYGPEDRAAVLARVGIRLARAGAGQDLWPGDDLHTPLSHGS
ncbi:hypothetical protein [Streptomyces sp. NBC_00140]|uniref:hypothetical protein n=1 Tax=Streptomyces sp. NBC_00140 TaxID=2975664 RepID=UPI0022563238|nr:hypothetical protein [Streptomyces sp. NBC_00140]MCX5327786.1 hypothetical protein [Streptomyces sp. NBC_00140]MCX5336847.1 hypothetical protein [Streptomyces sp. NBC_00140]